MAVEKIRCTFPEESPFGPYEVFAGVKVAVPSLVVQIIMSHHNGKVKFRQNVGENFVVRSEVSSGASNQFNIYVSM